MRIEFTIPITPVSKKNHSQIITVKGRPMLIPSKQYIKYEKDVMPFIPKLSEPISTPVCVKATFYKDTRRACDLMNLYQCLADVLVKYGVLADDNRNILYSVDGSRVLYDRDNGRTDVVITDIHEEEFESWK